MALPRKVLEWLIFGQRDARRWTQDSPVLPDVWIRYGQARGELAKERQDLLLVPHREATAGRVAHELRRALDRDARSREELGESPPSGSHEVAATPSTVAARASFGELVRVVIPHTSWWRKDVVDRLATRDGGERSEPDRERLGELLGRALRGDGVAEALDGLEPRVAERETEMPSHLLWMARVAGWIAWSRSDEAEPRLDGAELEELLIRYLRRRAEDAGGRGRRDRRAAETWEELLDELGLERGLRGPTPDAVADALADLFGGQDPPLGPPREAQIYLVNVNRPAELAVRQSALAVKSDAARKLFEIECADLCWAVIDSGVDARHPAFVPAASEGEDPATWWRRKSRVERTFDFTVLRKLLDPVNLRRLADGGGAPDDARLSPIHDRIRQWPEAERQERLDELRDLERFINSGRNVDWSFLEPLLEVPHDDDYATRPPGSHGTHVAGILAADWKDAPDGEMLGVAPDLRLYDMRVVGAGGGGDEFSVIAALQFVRWLNSRQDYQLIHGINLSLSIHHDVANYACGRTPVCEEAGRAVAAGIVAVAAAGNQGFTRYQTEDGPLDGYHTVSITDPGNADGVITVGATHRDRPHTYGVSYFSSRGPTGDGRVKPDLVAPGEKITAPIPDGLEAVKDGTSMAAPHVSGAAALLMARHRELIGDPTRIKRILCESATDLGREHYFQGRGMLDVLRALESI